MRHRRSSLAGGQTRGLLNFALPKTLRLGGLVLS